MSLKTLWFPSFQSTNEGQNKRLIKGIGEIDLLQAGRAPRVPKDVGKRKSHKKT